MPFCAHAYLLFECGDTIRDDHVFAQVARHPLVMLDGKLLLQFQHRNQLLYLLSEIIT